jgi:predicted hydrocarbon binding protein
MSDKQSLTHLAYSSVVDAIEEVIGENGKKAVFRFAGLEHLIDNPIDYDTEARVPYEYVSKLFLGVREILGNKGYNAVMYRGGIISVENMVKNSEPLRALIAMDFDPVEKLKMGYQVYVRNSGYDPEEILKHIPESREMLIHRADCSECNGLVNKNEIIKDITKPGCFFIKGIMQGIGYCFKEEISVSAEEIKCRLIGDEECLYRMEYVVKAND